MTQPPDDRVSAIDWFGVALIALCGVLAGLLETLLVPYYVGSLIMPITIVFAVVGNVALPWLARSLVPRTSAAVAPFIGWLIPVLGFLAIGRPEGDVILPGSPISLELVTYGVAFGGALAGVITLVWLAPPPVPRTTVRKPPVPNKISR